MVSVLPLVYLLVINSPNRAVKVKGTEIVPASLEPGTFPFLLHDSQPIHITRLVVGLVCTRSTSNKRKSVPSKTERQGITSGPMVPLTYCERDLCSSYLILFLCAFQAAKFSVVISVSGSYGEKTHRL